MTTAIAPYNDSKSENTALIFNTLCEAVRRPPNVTVQLTGGSSIFHGRVEIQVYDMWGTICDDGFGDKEAIVICRMLGHHSGGTVQTRSSYGGGSGPIWLDDVKCSGNETRIQDCVHRPWGSNNCGHDKDVAVLCHSLHGSLERQKMSIRLSGGASTTEGRIELFLNKKWGTVCEDGFDTKAAAVVCRRLGLPSSGAQPRFYGPGNGTIWLDDVRCTGNETRIAYCNRKPWGINNCNHNDDVGVHCDSGPPNVTVQLTGGSSIFHGRVEIQVYDMWGTICDDGFGDKEAIVICRMLGHHSGGTVQTRGSYGGGSGPIWLDDVKCFGNETRIQDCVHRPWGINNCGHDKDVAVLCHGLHDQPDDCFEYIPKLYPFLRTRTDAFFISEGISMNETKCKMECLHWRGKTCNGVFHHSLYDVNGTLQYSSCWGFEEDKRDSQFYTNNKMQHSRYFVRTCAPQKR